MIINLEFLTLDYIIIFLTVIFIMFAFWKGFINSILSLFGTIVLNGTLFIRSIIRPFGQHGNRRSQRPPNSHRRRENKKAYTQGML